MEKYQNMFLERSDEELRLLYSQYIEFVKTGTSHDNELRKIRDEYCSYFTVGVHMMEMDLLGEIARRWFNRSM